jgi:hypothetical protein
MGNRLRCARTNITLSSEWKKIWDKGDMYTTNEVEGQIHLQLCLVLHVKCNSLFLIR